MIVCGIDPGGTTGVVLIEWGGEVLPDPDALIRYDQVSFDSMPSFTDNLINGHHALTLPTPDLIVIERFHISTRTIKLSRQPEALYVIGAVMFYAKNAGIPVRSQNASDAKNAVPNEITECWPVKGPHARDALRHALLACRVRGLYARVSTGTDMDEDD